MEGDARGLIKGEGGGKINKKREKRAEPGGTVRDRPGVFTLSIDPSVAE